MASMEDQIRKQVEFYFSDSNYPKDKFLRAQAAQNEEGYIPLDVLSTFQRLKKLTTEKTVIAEALKKSPENQSYELNPEGTMVKRKKNLFLKKTLPLQGVSIQKVGPQELPLTILKQH